MQVSRLLLQFLKQSASRADLTGSLLTGNCHQIAAGTISRYLALLAVGCCTRRQMLKERLWKRRSLDFLARWPRSERSTPPRPRRTPAPSDVLRANSFAELLEPIPNAAALLRAVDKSRPNPPADENVQLAQYYHHHHHHHHHHAFIRDMDMTRIWLRAWIWLWPRCRGRAGVPPLLSSPSPSSPPPQLLPPRLLVSCAMTIKTGP